MWQKWTRRPLLGQIWGQRALYPGRTPAENLEKMLKTSLKLRAGPCGMIGTICAMKDKRNSSPLIVHAAKPQAMQVRQKKRMRENKREKREGRCGEQGNKQKGERGMYNLILSSHGHPLWMQFYIVMMVSCLLLVLFTQVSIAIATTQSLFKSHVLRSSCKTLNYTSNRFMVFTWRLIQSCRLALKTWEHVHRLLSALLERLFYLCFSSTKNTVIELQMSKSTNLLIL